MKGLIIISLMSICSVLTFARNAPVPDYKITGRVTDSKNAPVPFANVVLFNSPDSVFTKGTATDNDGKFEISTIPGSYYLKISFLSFQTKTISNIKVSNQHMALNKIVLLDNTERIPVDGKPSGLVGLKSTDALRQLQGDIIVHSKCVWFGM